MASELCSSHSKPRAGVTPEALEKENCGSASAVSASGLEVISAVRMLQDSLSSPAC